MPSFRESARGGVRLLVAMRRQLGLVVSDFAEIDRLGARISSSGGGGGGGSSLRFEQRVLGELDKIKGGVFSLPESGTGLGTRLRSRG